ncbi:hypothetical protein Tco_1319669 [Tanacetum coccineum]
MGTPVDTLHNPPSHSSSLKGFCFILTEFYINSIVSLTPELDDIEIGGVRSASDLPKTKTCTIDVLPEHRVIRCIHNEDGNPSRANIKQALGRNPDGSSCWPETCQFTTPCSHFIFLIKDIMIAERPTKQLRNSDACYHDPESVSHAGRRSQTSHWWQLLYNPRMIKRFTVADDLKKKAQRSHKSKDTKS